MNTKDFVSFETAKNLKEKGYPQCGRDNQYRGPKYTKDGLFTYAGFAEHYAAPTIKDAEEWLRTKYNLMCVCVPYAHEDGIGYAYKIYYLDEIRRCCSVKGQGAGYGEPSEAFDNAFRHCLTHFI